LISLTRDIDLTDDLLQETYLRARAGISGYLGGSERAWLSAIAKNVFYSYWQEQTRRTRFSLGTPADIENYTDNGLRPGSSDHLAVIELRKAISNLSPELRKALIMRHYGGFSCREIAEKLGWPTGTARQRVWTAMQRLKTVLATVTEEVEELKCSQVRGYRMLDYLYGVLPHDKAANIEAHIDSCPNCRREARELGRVSRTLDLLEGEIKIMHIAELNPDGTKKGMYCMLSDVNRQDVPMTSFGFENDAHLTIDYIITQGEQVEFEITPYEPDFEYPVPINHFSFNLPRPVQPGERFDTMFCFGSDKKAMDLGDGKWRARWVQCPETDIDVVFVLVMRLPESARLLIADPPPSNIKTNINTTTLIWRTLIEPGGEFESAVDYKL
jgi:RNA polymerase sigma-70 factor (ECF subfamily)